MKKCATSGGYLDTNTSVLVGSVLNDGKTYSLYRIPNYKYRYAISVGDSAAETSVADVSFGTAKTWAKDNLSKEEYEKEFCLPSSCGNKSRLKTSVQGETYTTFEKIRGNTGEPFAKILVDMIDYYEQTHGSLNE